MKAAGRSQTAAVWLGVFSMLCLAAAGAGGLAAGEITNYAGFYALSSEEAASHRPVRFAGVVLACDRDWGQLYVHDGNDVRWFDPRELAAQPRCGERVEITGTTTLVGEAISLTNLEMTVLGPGRLPLARSLTPRELTNAFGGWVETKGRVRVVDLTRGRMELALDQDGQGCLVTVLGPPLTNMAEQFQDATIRVRGINSSTIVDGRLELASVFVPGIEEIRIIEPADGRAAEPRLTSIDGLLSRELGPWTNESVRVSGTVAAYEPGSSLQVRDPTGVLRARILQHSEAKIDDRVRVSGLFRVTPEGPLLDPAWFEVLRSTPRRPPSVPVPDVLANQDGPAEILTKVSAIRQLPPQVTASGRQVRLRGVVLFADPDWGIGYLQDDRVAIFFDLDPSQGEVRSGSWVELTGQTSAGGFAPQIVSPGLTVLGSTNLPAPAKVDLNDLVGGDLDAQWVELEGVIQSATLEWRHLYLRIKTPQGRFEAIVPGFTGPSAPTNLVDSLVSVRGACSLETNARGQVAGVTLHVPALEQIRTLQAAPANPFALNATPISAVATFDPNRLAGRRVKVSGVVTLVSPDRGFFLQDDSGGMRVQLLALEGIQPGDELEAVGFPALGEFSPELTEVSVRRMGAGVQPTPLETTAESILLHGEGDGMVVSLEALLLQDVPRAANPQLLLQDGGILFTARLEDAARGREMPAFTSGSVLRLSGVCSVQRGEQREAKGFRIRLRSAADVVLVSAPSWWTARRALWVLGGLVGALGLVLGWVRALRAQVASQTRTLREQLAERERMQLQIEQTHKQLLQASRQAGMAEVATGVLHNLGNVLNSVNVSVTLVADRVKASRLERLPDALRMLEERKEDLSAFLRDDPKGQRLLPYLGKLAQHLGQEQSAVLQEVETLTKSIEHIKAIVAVQQDFARVSGVIETFPAADLFEDALEVNRAGLERHSIRIVREFDPVPPMQADKHKVLQILLNLIRNAKAAMKAGPGTDRVLCLRVRACGSDRIRLQVQDTGEGLSPDAMTRIFSHGFTTKRDGHGFGLHMGALAARQMGGTLNAESGGPGRGATFTLELPLRPPAAIPAAPTP